MREILFRGKRVDNGEWVYGYYSLMSGKSKMLIDRTASNSNDWVYKEVEFNTHLICNFLMPDRQGWDYDEQCQFHKVIPETVGQFTGRFDKQGKKVFEGDKVNVIGRKRIGNYTTEIIYDGMGFRLKENKTYFVDYRLVKAAVEVIGTIHD